MQCNWQDELFRFDLIYFSGSMLALLPQDIFLDFDFEIKPSEFHAEAPPCILYPEVRNVERRPWRASSPKLGTQMCHLRLTSHLSEIYIFTESFNFFQKEC